MAENTAYPEVEVTEETPTAQKKKAKKDVFEQSSVPANELYQLVYKHNKSFELHVNREVIRFENGHVVFPQKYIEGFPKEVIESEEFKLHSDNFVVKTKGE